MKIQATDTTILIFGRPRTGKTTWALGACNSNYAVTVLDIENNLVPALVHPKAENIEAIPLAYAGGNDYNPAVKFAVLLRNADKFPFTWDIDARKQAIGQLDPTRNYVRVDLSRTHPHEVLVVDGWSVLAHQLVIGKTPEPYAINLTGSKDDAVSSPMWGSYVRDADALLDIFRAVKIPVKIILGHEYEEVGHIFPVSVTRNHGQKLVGRFAHAARLTLQQSEGNTIRHYDSTGLGGSGKCQKILLDKYPCSMLLSELRHEAPSSFTPSKAFTFGTGEEIVKMLQPTEQQTTLTASKTIHF